MLSLPKQLQSDKTHEPHREIYVQIPLECPICRKLRKKSKKFSSPYALMYHLTDWHGREDEILSKITVAEVHRGIRLVCNAYKIGVLRP